MGSLVEKLAKEGGETTATASRAEDLDLSDADVCIDFSHASQVPLIVKRCVEFRVPLVIGTTGWEGDFDQVRHTVNSGEIGVVYSANFSVGIFLVEHLLTSLSSALKQIRQPHFEVAIHEIHHSKKVDAPSGTALQLSKLLTDHPIDISSLRCGTFPGTHTVYVDGPDETISLTHTAKHRNGFAEGALLAARSVVRSDKGLLTFHELLRGHYGL